MITDCVVDPQRLEPFQEAMQTWGIEIEQGINLHEDEWALSVISPFAVAYSCGMIERHGATIELTIKHNHDPAELERCVQLAYRTASLMEGIDIFPSRGAGYFMPFFVTANHGGPVADVFTEEVVRALFGGTIDPAAPILIEPLAETTEWWQAMLEDYRYDRADEEERQELDEIFDRWRALFRWFNTHEELHGCAYIKIGKDRHDQNGVELPRLVVAITRAGSIVGICGCETV